MAPTDDIAALFARTETFRHRGVAVTATVQALPLDEYRALVAAEKAGQEVEAYRDFLRRRVSSLVIGDRRVDDPGDVAGVQALVGKLVRSALRDHVQEADSVKDMEAAAKIKEREAAGSGLRWLCETVRYWQIEAGRDQGNG